MEPQFVEHLNTMNEEQAQPQKRKIAELEDEVGRLKDINVLSYKNERFLFGLFQKEKRRRKKVELEMKQPKCEKNEERKLQLEEERKQFEEERNQFEEERAQFEQDVLRFKEEREKIQTEQNQTRAEILEETKKLETERILWFERYLNIGVVDLTNE